MGFGGQRGKAGREGRHGIWWTKAQATEGSHGFWWTGALCPLSRPPLLHGSPPPDLPPCRFEYGAVHPSRGAAPAGADPDRLDDSYGDGGRAASRTALELAAEIRPVSGEKEMLCAQFPGFYAENPATRAEARQLAHAVSGEAQ